LAERCGSGSNGGHRIANRIIKIRVLYPVEGQLERIAPGRRAMKNTLANIAGIASDRPWFAFCTICVAARRRASESRSKGIMEADMKAFGGARGPSIPM